MNKKLTNIREKYSEALIENNKERVMLIMEAAVKNGTSPLELYTRVAIPAQTSLGQLWASGEISVSHEHLATQITIEVLDYLKRKVRAKPSIGLKALVATPSGDSHYLAARVVADFLKFDGWDVDFLGVDTPSNDLAAYIKDHDYSLVGLSVTLPKYLPETKHLISLIKEQGDAPKIIVGGSAVRFAVEEAKELEADAVVISLEDAPRVARRLLGSKEKEINLPRFLKSLGKSIQQTRKSRRLSQASLANSCGLDRAYISSVENGKHNVTIGALIKIAGALSTPVEDLILEQAISTEI